MKFKWVLWVSVFFSLLLINSVSFAITGAELKEAFGAINQPGIDSNEIYAINNLTLESKDLKLHLDSGNFYFYNSITIDSSVIQPGGFFIGQGRFEFNPQVTMERDQLRRFYESDSLLREFKTAELFFSKEFAEAVKTQSTSQGIEKVKDLNKMLDKLHENITIDDYKYYDFQTLKNLVEKWPEPYFLVNLELEDGGSTLYSYDPTEREEVRLYKKFWDPRFQFMELICSYHSSLTNEMININGKKKDNIISQHYAIDARVDKNGRFYGNTDYTFQVVRSGTRMIALILHPELYVNKVTDSSGNIVAKISSEKGEKKQSQLYVLFDRPLSGGEIITLNFEYLGDIAEKIEGEFFVSAGAYWYPRYDGRSRTTFEIKFNTPKFYNFICSGTKKSENITADSLFTEWEIKTPVKSISFNIGNMDKFEFVRENLPVVEVHFSKDLHRQIASYEAGAGHMVRHGKNMEEQVAEDVLNSLKLFEHDFGECSLDKIVVTEILQYHYGEAFTGFLHLGYKTWESTDPWGQDRMLRSHEVAHQWWGAGVGFETYHDQWLSEAFAEYSSLIYLQAVSGADKFFDKLKDYREDIYSVRKFLFSKGKESGPIALGYRTSSSETRGDYGLVIYKKGAYVLHMLRNMLIDLNTLDDKAFFDMLKDFYQMYNGKSANTDDFKKLVELYTGMEMDWFFEQWVYGNELPEYEFKYELKKGDDGYYHADCQITQTNVSDGFKNFVPIEIEFDEGKAYLRLLVDKPLYEFKLPPLQGKPKKIRLNPFESVLAKVKQ